MGPADQIDEVDHRRGALALDEFDARQHQEFRDEPVHPVGFGRHGGEEALARDRIVPCRTLQCLDEAADRRQRGADLVTHIGDEIAHQALRHVLGGALPQHQQDPGRCFGDAHASSGRSR
jgi:hypothetical protein